jgi:hypothetical protein
MERVCVQMKSNEQPAVIREINADKSAVIELGTSQADCSRWTVVDGNPEGARYGACDGRKRDRARRHTYVDGDCPVTDYSRYGFVGMDSRFSFIPSFFYHRIRRHSKRRKRRVQNH